MFYIRKEGLENQIYNCKKDSDCISIKAGCCSCTAGGKNTAINKNYKNYWNDKLSNACINSACPMVLSNDWTCFAEPKCVNEKCKLILVK